MGEQNVQAACLKDKLEFQFLLKPWIRLFFELVRVQSTEKAILWGDVYHVPWWHGTWLQYITWWTYQREYFLFKDLNLTLPSLSPCQKLTLFLHSSVCFCFCYFHEGLESYLDQIQSCPTKVLHKLVPIHHFDIWSACCRLWDERLLIQTGVPCMISQF